MGKDLSHNRNLKEAGEQGHHYLEEEHSRYTKLKVQRPCVRNNLGKRLVRMEQSEHGEK